MSRRMFKALVLGALVVTAFAAVVSSASAANWVSNGARSFSGSAATTFLKINSPTGAGVSCTNAGTANGSLKATPSPAIATPSAWLGAATITPTFTTCTSTGFSATVTCANGTTLNANSFAGTTVTGGLSAISCRIAVPSLGCGTVASGTVSTVGITVTGSVAGTFDNSTQKLVVHSNGSNQGLSATAAANCDGVTGFSGGGTAAANFGSTSAGTGNVTYTVTGSPSIWTS
jgi:hypothetical protein